jgi:hypothetical protein
MIINNNRPNVRKMAEKKLHPTFILLLFSYSCSLHPFSKKSEIRWATYIYKNFRTIEHYNALWLNHAGLRSHYIVRLIIKNSNITPFFEHYPPLLPQTTGQALDKVN